MSQHELWPVTEGDAGEHSFALFEHIWTVKAAGAGCGRTRWVSKGSLRPTARSRVLQEPYSGLHSFFILTHASEVNQGRKNTEFNRFGLKIKINGGRVVFSSSARQTNHLDVT